MSEIEAAAAAEANERPDYSYLRGIDGEPQIPTHFPNDNSKRIDYVISYKYNRKYGDNATTATADQNNLSEEERKHLEKQAIRQNFLQKLHQEGFDVTTIRWRADDVVHVYLLLYCRVERLFDEAERTKLEMRLNNVENRNRHTQ